MMMMMIVVEEEILFINFSHRTAVFYRFLRSRKSPPK